MTPSFLRATSRRRFLQYLAGSPPLASPSLAAYGMEAPSKLPDPMIWAPPGSAGLIERPKDAINVFDFEPVARKNVPPAHFGYMASGIDDEVTLRANREDFLKFQLMPHRLNDVSKVDTGIELFGTRYDSPIFVCPTGANQFFHPEGELAVARAARSGNHLQILSTSSNYSVDDVTKARGAPVWFQLYASPSWEVAQALIKRADGAGCPVLMVTVDRVAGRNQETLFRLMKSDTRDCSGCHDRSSFASRALRRHNYDGIDLTGIKGSGESSNLNWDTVKRMRDITRMKIMLKGIVTAEDAELAAQNGIDGILVSNHGGRGEDNGRSTIDALPEIVAAVKGRMVIVVDSGFRRGTDAVKALAMGARRSESDGPICGASVRSARKAWSGCWRSSAPKRERPCNNAARARSKTSIRASCGGRLEGANHHCGPMGRANARPITGSAKQSRKPGKCWIASSLALLAMTVI